jgi:hypothetical protein
MVRIHFSDADIERKALGFLVGRFNFKTSSNGETLVPENALAALAIEGISYTVEGPATYEQSAPPIRSTSAA